MTKQSIAIALALIVAIMPFLGFPSEMRDLFYTAAGIIIAGLVHLSAIAYCSACREKIENGIVAEKDEEPEYVEDIVEEPKESEEDFGEQAEEVAGGELSEDSRT
jgi:hypothetical protein